MTYSELASVYPRVERPRVAEAAYRHALTLTTHAVLLSAAQAQASTLSERGRYCPDLATWLLEERWRAKIPGTAAAGPDEFGYYPGQFEPPQQPDETDEEKAHREWVEQYLENLRREQT